MRAKANLDPARALRREALNAAAESFRVNAVCDKCVVVGVLVKVAMVRVKI
jgi:hypothetical protein